MQVKVTVSESIKKKAEEKALKIKKFMMSPIQVSFVLSKDKVEHLAELTVTGDGAHLTSYVAAKDFSVAIDDSIDKIIVQLKKYKDKIKTKKGGKKASEVAGD